VTRLTQLSLANRTVVLLVCFILVGAGFVAMGSLKQELIPSIESPAATVVAVHPGAAPDVVEREVSRPLEDAAKAVSGVTRVTSRSATGVSTVRVEWEFGTGSEKVLADLRTAVDGQRSRLPSDVSPQVVAGRFDDVPIIVFAVSSPQDRTELSRKLKDVVAAKLKTLPGVRDVTIAGEEKQQVVITLRPTDVDRLGVETATFPQVFAASGIAVPAGSLPTGGATLDVEVGRTLTAVEDVKAIRVQGTDGPVTLAEIADVALTPVDTTSISRANGKPSLTVAVTKEQSGNTVAVSQAVRAELPALIARVGGGAVASTVFDQSPYIESSIHDLTVEGGLGLAMAVIVILLFLGSMRSTIITAISIPLSLLIALIGLWTGKYTLNILTLGALTVAIGRVVDDSIVVIENIKRHQGMGEFGMPSIVRAVREVAGAVTSSTLTTVAVFLPIGLVSGQTGELFRPFAMTVTIALLASLFVALTVVPVLASWFMRPHRQARPAPPAEAESALAESAAYGSVVGEPGGLADAGAPTRLQRSYLPALRWALGHRVVTLVLAVFVVGATIAAAPRLKTDFLGSMGATTLRVVQDLPAGTALESTDAAAKRVEAVVAAEPTVVSYTTTVGGDPSRVFFGTVAGPNQASISITLAAGSDGAVVGDRLRAAIGGLSDVGTVEVVSSQSNTDVALIVESADPQALRTGSDQVAAMLATIPGMRNVRTDLTNAKQMLKVDIDPQAASRAGMVQAQIGQAVNQAVRGQKVGTITLADTTTDVVLRSRAPVTTVAELRALPLPITQKQVIDARKAAGTAVEDQQKALQRKAQADQDAAVAEQITSLRESRTKAQDAIAALNTQVAALTAQLARISSLPPGSVPPTPVDPTATLRAQLAQLQKSLEAARAQLTATDTALTKALDARAKTQRSRSDSEALSQAAKDAQTAKATPVLLDDVADVTEVSSPASIGRVDGVRAATVNGTPQAGDVGGVTSSIQAKLKALTLPDGVSVRIGGVSQAQQESFAQLGLAMLVAIAIVYLIMVTTFRSLLQPLILMVSVPFAATGAVGLLLATGTPLGIPAMIGLLMLIGIVVTNAIVLIDLINQYREHGASIAESIIDGARLRLRPIIMTAAATIFALLPMALGVTGGGIFISKPLAIVVIGGLVSSTVLTLLLVPVLYDIVERLRERRLGRRARPPAQPPVAVAVQGS
jgi:multidrug efflux pump subunit AcrB